MRWPTGAGRLAAPQPTSATGRHTAISDLDTRSSSSTHARSRLTPTWARRGLRRTRPYLQFIVGIGLLVAALWVLSSHTDELSGLSSVFSHLNWWWLIPAVAAEAGSFASFARVQYELLRAGGVHAPMRALFPVTLASQAMIDSLPAGTAVAAVYGFRWYRRFGADDTLAAWSLLGTAVAATVSLALVAAAGAATATGYGGSLDLIPVIIGVLVVAVLIGALFVYERPLAFMVTLSLRALRRLAGRPRGDLMASIDHVIERVTSVRLGWRQVVAVVGWALGNWVLDCTCFVFSFAAVGVAVPWNGLLLAYGAGQLAANLPITPGGLGAVEGSITIALVAFGGARLGTVEAVLIYRLINFWAQLVVGWLSAGWLVLGIRKGRWPRYPSRRSPAGLVAIPAQAGEGAASVEGAEGR